MTAMTPYRPATHRQNQNVTDNPRATTDASLGMTLLAVATTGPCNRFYYVETAALNWATSSAGTGPRSSTAIPTDLAQQRTWS